MYECVAEELGLCGLAVVPEETQKALVELMESGLAKAYRLSSREPFAQELKGLPPFDGSRDYYFWITEEVSFRQRCLSFPQTYGWRTQEYFERPLSDTRIVSTPRRAMRRVSIGGYC